MPESALHIDGVPVESEVAPQSAAELAQVMKEACTCKLSMIPVGGGTQLFLGNPPRSADLALHTRQLRGVVEYEPDNLTAAVRAGTTLQELQEILARENQFLPLDTPHPQRATIGGLLATNASGPLRFRYGTLRDMLLGIEIVHANGARTRAGGKLVKNVSGYDMCKLYAGSLGTLGVISEMTFKVQPKPEAVATAMVACPALPAALETTQCLLRADLMPDAMEAVNDAAFAAATGMASAAPWVLLLRFGETDAAVRWQLDRLRILAPEAGGEVVNVLGTAESGEFWQNVASARSPLEGTNDLWFRCSVLYQSMAETSRRMSGWGERLQAKMLMFCHAGSMILHGRYRWPDGDCAAEELARAVAELRRYCVSVGGHLVVEKARPEVKHSLDVWGYETPALEMMRRIKSGFDPQGLLNPGRFVGGI